MNDSELTPQEIEDIKFIISKGPKSIHQFLDKLSYFDKQRFINEFYVYDEDKFLNFMQGLSEKYKKCYFLCLNEENFVSFLKKLGNDKAREEYLQFLELDELRKWFDALWSRTFYQITIRKIKKKLTNLFTLRKNFGENEPNIGWRDISFRKIICYSIKYFDVTQIFADGDKKKRVSSFEKSYLIIALENFFSEKVKNWIELLKTSFIETMISIADTCLKDMERPDVIDITFCLQDNNSLDKIPSIVKLGNGGGIMVPMTQENFESRKNSEYKAEKNEPVKIPFSSLDNLFSDIYGISSKRYLSVKNNEIANRKEFISNYLRGKLRKDLETIFDSKIKEFDNFCSRDLVESIISIIISYFDSDFYDDFWKKFVCFIGEKYKNICQQNLQVLASHISGGQKLGSQSLPSKPSSLVKSNSSEKSSNAVKIERWKCENPNEYGELSGILSNIKSKNKVMGYIILRVASRHFNEETLDQCMIKFNVQLPKEEIMRILGKYVVSQESKESQKPEKSQESKKSQKSEEPQKPEESQESEEGLDRDKIVNTFLDLLHDGGYVINETFKNELMNASKSNGRLLKALRNINTLPPMKTKTGKIKSCWTIEIKKTGRRVLLEKIDEKITATRIMDHDVYENYIKNV